MASEDAFKSELRASIPPGQWLDDSPKLARASATFVDAGLEREFQKENFEVSIRRFARFGVPVALASFLSYGIHDALVVPEIRGLAWLIRYALFGPVAALLVLFVMRNRKWERHQAAMLVFGLSVNAVVIAIGALGNTAGYFLYSSYAVVFVTLGPFLGRMNVRTQLLYTALTLALYNGIGALVGHAELAHRISLNIAITTLGVIGALMARQLEMQARVAYIQRRVIRDQMVALEAERFRSESLLLNVLPRRIAERLKADPKTTIADRFESATVLFSDIVGFTELSARLAPDAIVHLLDQVFSSFDAIADQLGLEKIKTIGDAYMVAGGVPLPRKDHAEAICAMALRMRDCIAEVSGTAGVPFEVRIGIHTGPVVAGVIGTKKFIYDVWGDTVNTASRMESHGRPGAIQVSEVTWSATRDAFEYESRGPISVKGLGEMPTYFLLGRREQVEGRVASLPKERVRAT